MSHHKTLLLISSGIKTFEANEILFKLIIEFRCAAEDHTERSSTVGKIGLRNFQSIVPYKSDFKRFLIIMSRAMKVLEGNLTQ